MKTTAVRLYGKNDLRMETFELPAIQDDEILVKIISDSICMSSYKATIQGEDHKRVPKDIAEHPIIIGHEFCGEIVQVGPKWADKYKAGDKFTIQPAHELQGPPGHAGLRLPVLRRRRDLRHPAAGSDADELPARIQRRTASSMVRCPSRSPASWARSMRSITRVTGSYQHEMGIVEGGNLAILAGAGPMGLGAIDYAIHCDRKPGLLVVTDIDQARLDRAAIASTRWKRRPRTALSSFT